MSPFMVSWHPFVGGKPFDRQQLLNALETIPEVLNWRASTGAVFVISEANHVTLAERIRQKFPDLLFVITPINIFNMQGWTDKDTWDFITRPRRAGQP